MLSNDTLQFLKKLKKNNHKIWFEANKKGYENAQAEIRLFAEEWIKQYGKKDPTIAHLDPKKCIFRIYRDVRFSKNKSPYKNNLGAYLSKGGKDIKTAGFYLHIEPGNCMFGAGNYMPDSEVLSKIRQEIDYNFKDFEKIITQKKFKSIFGGLDTELKLKRAPKGYEEENPALELLKLKSFTVFRKIDDSEIIAPQFIQTVTNLCIASKPLVDFLNTAFE